jgi:hypothetical protein
MTRAVYHSAIAFFLASCLTGCGGQPLPPKSPNSDGTHEAASEAKLAPHVIIAYANDGCSFKFSPVDFCDAKHLASIARSIAAAKANFNGHYILTQIEEWPENYQSSIIAIDVRSGAVIPAPIDAYAGKLRSDGSVTGPGLLKYDSLSNELCIEGSILDYRTITEGTFCFRLVGDRFVGYATQYMSE